MEISLPKTKTYCSAPFRVGTCATTPECYGTWEIGGSGVAGGGGGGGAVCFPCLLSCPCIICVGSLSSLIWSALGLTCTTLEMAGVFVWSEVQ